MNEKGRKAEDAAARYLEKNGYCVLERNYHSRYGEIDIICKKDTFLVFAEVKERKLHSLVHPLETVTRKKREKIILTARQYLLQMDFLLCLQPRFDVIALWEECEGEYAIHHLENAFGEEEVY